MDSSTATRGPSASGNQRHRSVGLVSGDIRELPLANIPTRHLSDINLLFCLERSSELRKLAKNVEFLHRQRHHAALHGGEIGQRRVRQGQAFRRPPWIAITRPVASFADDCASALPTIRAFITTVNDPRGEVDGGSCQDAMSRQLFRQGDNMRTWPRTTLPDESRLDKLNSRKRKFTAIPCSLALPTVAADPRRILAKDAFKPSQLARRAPGPVQVLVLASRPRP